MIDIEKIENIDDKKHIALLDTSSISFMQGLKMKGIQPEDILKDYDLILIPEWVLTEINDAPGRANYEAAAQLARKAEITLWEKYDDTHTMVRFVTDWATQQRDVDMLVEILEQECNPTLACVS